MKARRKLFEDKAVVNAASRDVEVCRRNLAELDREFSAVAQFLADRRLSLELLRLSEVLASAHLRFRGTSAEQRLDQEREHRDSEQRRIQDRLWDLRRRPRYPGEDAIALDPPDEQHGAR